MTARFKAKLAARQPVIVMNPDHPSPSLVEFIARLGVDAVMIDCEQGSPNMESVEDMARAARAVGLCALVRIAPPDASAIERYMFAACMASLFRASTLRRPRNASWRTSATASPTPPRRRS